MRPPASPRLSVRSYLACDCGALSERRRQAGQLEGSSSWFCQANIIWNIGSCARLRGGRTISTTCSNGKS